MASTSRRGGGEDDDDEPYLLGFIVANAVGLQYYQGGRAITRRESVGLVREPHNPHDANAIRVDNARGEKIGHIGRRAAAALAPLLDAGHVAAAHGIVPKPASKRLYSLPCQVHLFARPPHAALVAAALAASGIDLIHVDHPEFALSESAIVQEQQTKRSRGDVDRLFSHVGKGGRARIAPMEAPRDVVVSELFEHQKAALGWLVHREESCDLPPFWEEDNDGGFKNVLTNQKTNERPPPLKGGIFADDMGLGKTLTLLSLIGRSKARNVGGKKARGAKRRKVEEAVEEESRTTLVVCPPSVFSSWVTQLEEHTKTGSLKVYLYHGERTKEKKELLKYDIVITTYSTLGQELEQEGSPVKEIEWFRVILDEAHVIKNSAARQTKAVIALNAERRWVVTGTPIQNSSFDLYPLMAFLRFQPFSIKSYWQSLIQLPLERKNNRTGLARLQSLLGAISLRRTKETESGSKSLVSIPPKTVLACYIELSAEEREYYDQMELEGKNKLREFGDRDSILRNYSTVLYFILRLRQLCNDIALCPLDLKSWLPGSGSSLEDVSKNPELLKKLASLVDDGDDFECPICLAPPAKTVITSCTHIYCQTCIMKILKSSSSRCPICRRLLCKEDLFIAPEIKHPDEDSSVNLDRPLSSKVQALLKLLRRSQSEDPLSKSVIFSQFRKMLILLEGPLKAAGFNILRLDGSMTAKKRSEVIRQFGCVGPDSPTVLLASLKAAGAGVNLTAASTVYLFDPWWNPGVEEQAMDRVHRIGQTKEVKVVRLIVKDSIEERMLELQERKKKLISGAFGRKKGGKEHKEIRVEELQMMMGMK
ncbi:putative SWI/SNF-related matrix-associated actin-dependent regulator of chromatin subfamily A member 3-like 1 [Oryza glaberrima]|uniref:SWI/SNF-related matrix-associated actin-dependent regulator of chromatin subfamily A member 3-like 1 n=2 Tax=Oryza TaxID=4527 RepID=A0A0D3GU51_9ORYZ|nr:putative SWI/SNF-related matrix-associated actin-dependent regulator of chromatin subfamily A member 3-like 1 [Oryza glaberrima]